MITRRTLFKALGLAAIADRVAAKPQISGEMADYVYSLSPVNTPEESLSAPVRHDRPKPYKAHHEANRRHIQAYRTDSAVKKRVIDRHAYHNELPGRVYWSDD